MAYKVPIAPGVPRGQAKDVSRAMDASNLAQQRTAIEHAGRLNESFPMDGTEPFKAPLPLQRLPTGDLPPPADHAGTMIFDTTLGRVVQSDGVAWNAVPTPDDVSQAAFEEVTGAISESETIEAVIIPDPPDIQLHVKQQSLTSLYIAPNAIGPEELAPSGVAAGVYVNPTIGVDADGRITTAIGGTASPWVKLLGSSIGVAQTTLDIVFNSQIIATPFHTIKIMLGALIPSNDDVSFHVQFSTDFGSTWLTSGYKYAMLVTADDSNAFNQFSAGLGTSIFLTSSGVATTMVGNQAREGWSGELSLQDWQKTVNPRINVDANYWAANVGEALLNVRGSGGRNVANSVNALRFFFSAGTINSGTFDVYGVQ